MSASEVQPVGLAILGAGTIASVHGLASLETPEVEVRSVWSRTGIHARALADRLGCPAFKTPEQALKAPGVEAAVVATPTFLHEEHALLAARAGKHVICEKPLARDLDAAERIIAACEQAGVRLLPAHVVRFFPDLEALHREVGAGRVGKPALARLSRATTFPHGRDEWHSHYELSGGVVLDMGLHDLDWLLWTFGPAERVYSQGLYSHNLPNLDYALTTVRHACGVIAHVESSWAETSGFRVQAEVAGDSGLRTYDSERSAPYTLQLRQPPDEAPGVTVPTAYTAVSPYVLQIVHLARVVRGLEEPLVSPEEGFQALRLALAALESIQSGQPVGL